MPTNNSLTAKFSVVPLLIAMAYALWAYFAIGFRGDHLLLIVLCLGLYYASLATRKFVIGYTPIIGYWTLYDSLRVFPNFNFKDAAIKELYDAEKALFGINTPNGIITPNEYFMLPENTSTFLDVFSGLCYINWISVPLLLLVYLWVKDKKYFVHFILAFFTVNIIGVFIYYLYPAAAPWYVTQYGFERQYGILGSPAGLAKFDEFFGIGVFQNMYGMNPNVFGAMPSLHCAFPTLVLLYGLGKFKWLNLLFALHAVGMWFAAVYTQHHYILDVLAGIGCAVLTYLLLEKILMEAAWYPQLYGKLGA